MRSGLLRYCWILCAAGVSSKNHNKWQVSLFQVLTPPWFTDEVVCFGSRALPIFLRIFLIPSVWEKFFLLSSEDSAVILCAFLANSSVTRLFSGSTLRLLGDFGMLSLLAWLWLFKGNYSNSLSFVRLLELSKLFICLIMAYFTSIQTYKGTPASVDVLDAQKLIHQ